MCLEKNGRMGLGVYRHILAGGFKHDFYFPFHIWDNPSAIGVPPLMETPIERDRYIYIY